MAIDGSLFNKHPRLPEWMDQALLVLLVLLLLLPPSLTLCQELGIDGVKLKSQPDGSGVGAAVTAAAYVA